MAKTEEYPPVKERKFSQPAEVSNIRTVNKIFSLNLLLFKDIQGCVLQSI